MPRYIFLASSSDKACTGNASLRSLDGNCKPVGELTMGVGVGKLATAVAVAEVSVA